MPGHTRVKYLEKQKWQHLQELTQQQPQFLLRT